jgi:hypothetical protein
VAVQSFFRDRLMGTRSPARWNCQRQRYVMAVALATAALANVVAFLPPDRKALA